ncbi:MAG: hypothetical protein KDA93_16925 [Planctomycetaceae bacterium]|nr:hypothetical protein [Planctomycetaceae bacterium]
MSEHPAPPTASAPLLEMMGLKPNFRSDWEGPPPDEAKLRRYLAGELDRNAEDDVLSAVMQFRTWYDVLVRLVDAELIERVHREEGSNQS